MDSNPLLAALQSNYGDGSPPPPDTSTVRGLLTFCKLWLDGEVETAELNNPCMAMSGRLKGAAKDTEQDLRQNPDLIAEMRAPIKRSAEAYQKIAELLDRLPQVASDNDTQEYKSLIEVFEQERQAVLDATAKIERLQSGDVRLCPRCGQAGEGTCEKCGLVRLYPDPRATEYSGTKTAMLEPAYAQLYQAYVDVMSGVRSLPVVIQATNPLEDVLVELQKGFEQVLENVKDDDDPTSGETRETANRLLDEIENVFEGIDRIRGAHESYQMSDLSRGWDAVFDSAVDIQRVSQRYAKTVGLDDEDEQSDMIDIAGE